MTEPVDEEASAAALASGQLPLQAQQRLQMMERDHAFTSDLTVDEFAACKAVGFDPVGQVLGTTVYQIGFSGYGWCGYTGPYGMMQGGLGYRQRWGVPAGTGWQGYDYLVQALHHARHLALERMRAEAAALGGDGVVAVHLTLQHFPGTTNAIEFQAIGTAVRARSKVRPPRPFLSDLSGQDFALLIGAGWVPIDIAIGIAVEIQHDDWTVRSQRGVFGNAPNTEVDAYTALVTRARHEARSAFESDAVRVGGEVAVLRSSEIRISEQECQGVEGTRDHIAEATWIGTSAVPFKRRPHPATHRTLPILRLDQRKARQ